MRLGLTVSAIGHGALVIWGVLVLPGATSYDLSLEQPLPVDVVSIEEYTRIASGARDGEAEQSGAPEPAEEVQVAERTTPEPERREQSVAPEPPPPPEVRPEPEPVETAAVPPAPAPAPEPRPEPEPEPAAQAEPAPMRADAPVPRARPETPPRRAEPEARPEPRQAAESRSERDFDPDRIAALINRVPDSGGVVQGESGAPTAGLGRPSGRDDRLSIGEIDALRRQIARCWNPPIGVVEADRLVVRIGLELNPDGSLAAAPRVLGGSTDPIFTVAAEAAMRAVGRCQPYELPAEKYDLWREIHVNFDPREILGG